jgi:menaquinone-specific isochorismate synthase
MERQRGEEVPGLVTRAERVDAPRPRAVLAAADVPRTLWHPPDGPVVVGSGAAVTVEAAGADRFAVVREAAADLFAAGDVHAGASAARPRLFGGFSFHDEHDPAPPWGGFPGARFVLPARQVTYTSDGAWLTVNATDAPTAAVEERLDEGREWLGGIGDPGHVSGPPGVVGRERTTSLSAWRTSVEAAVDRIRAGELRKVVLAQALRVDLADALSAPDVLARLDDTYPDCYRFLVDGDGGAFFGATPERLLTVDGRTVETGALAGTTGRGDTPEEDEWLATELLDDDKNNHEHDLVVEAIRDQLEPFAASVSTGQRTVRKLETVQHLQTPITADLREAEHVLDLVEALHPTPAVGGLPPDEALATIRETEPFERGWYAAPVGWFDAAGYGSFAVAIRSAVGGDRTATLFAGVGLVADSDPDREWDEVQLKYRPVLDELE